MERGNFMPGFGDGGGLATAMQQRSYNLNEDPDELQDAEEFRARPDIPSVNSFFPPAVGNGRGLNASNQQPYNPNSRILGGFEAPKRSYAEPGLSFMETISSASTYSPRVFTTVSLYLFEALLLD